MKARYFATAAAFRKWLLAHHATQDELLVGFHKVDSGTPSMTWPESVDVALCFGWIDGIRRRVDDKRYTIRFTPRRTKSMWSAVNVRRFGELAAMRRMTAAGRAAFERGRKGSDEARPLEQLVESLDRPSERIMKQHRAAWNWWKTAAPSYRRIASRWVMSAKKPETRTRRLALLIRDCAARERIGPLRRAKAR